jgi:cytidine deaminase
MSSIPSTSAVQTAPISDAVQKTQQLMLFAMEARNQSYSPYSKFRVGACLLADDGISYYAGCNVECASYGTIHTRSSLLQDP